MRAIANGWKNPLGITVMAIVVKSQLIFHDNSTIFAIWKNCIQIKKNIQKSPSDHMALW